MSQKLLVVTNESIIEFVVVIPDTQTHDEVKARVRYHLEKAEEVNPYGWTYSGISSALSDEGFTIIGGNALEEMETA